MLPRSRAALTTPPAQTLAVDPPVLLPHRRGLANRFAHGIVWSLVANVSAQGATFASNVLIANIVGRSVFGEFAMVLNTLLSASLLGQCATGFTVTKYLAELRFSDRERAGRVVALCSAISGVSAAITAVACAVGAGPIAALFRAPQLVLAFRLGAVFLGLSIVNGYQAGVLQGLERYRPLARANMVSGGATLLLCAILTRLFGVNGAVAALALSAVVKWLLLERSIAIELREAGIRLDYRRLKEEGRVFKRFGLPAALTGLTMAPSPWIAHTLLVRQPNGFAAMAVYGAAMNMVTMVAFLPKVIDRVSMSLLNGERGTRNHAGYRRVLKLNLLLALSSALVGSLFAALFGASFLRLFGKSFAADGYGTLLILLAAPIFDVVTSAFAQVLESNEKMWTRILVVNLPRDLCFPIAAYLLVSRGAAGTAWAYLLSQFVAFLAITLLMAKETLWARSRCAGTGAA